LAIQLYQNSDIRAAGKDEAVVLTPPIALTLEYAVEFIADDELCEVTPKSIRIRKRHLEEHERKRAARELAGGHDCSAAAAFAAPWASSAGFAATRSRTW
jgi:hypothetical protein